MSLAIFIANRLSLRSPSGKMQSGIVIAVSGIALSVVVMLISIAVMMGFKEEIRQKIMGFDAQLSISVYSPDDSKVPLVDINDVRPVLEMLPEKATTVLAIRQPVILKTPADFTGAIVKGISRDYESHRRGNPGFQGRFDALPCYHITESRAGFISWTWRENRRFFSWRRQLQDAKTESRGYI